MAAQTQRALGWDPVLIICQVGDQLMFLAFKLLIDCRRFKIIAMQALHYLTLSLLIPPLLWLFAEPNTLTYEGGAANVGELRNSQRRADLTLTTLY